MVSMRFTSFLLVFLLLHIIIRAHSHQTIKKIGAKHGEAETTLGDANKVQLIYQDIKVSVPAAAEVVKNRRLQGRKMVSNEDFMRRDGGKNGNLNHLAVEVSGSCNSKNVECRRNKGIHHPKIDVFAEFSADYYVPRSHPPKNN